MRDGVCHWGTAQSSLLHGGVVLPCGKTTSGWLPWCGKKKLKKIRTVTTIFHDRLGILQTENEVPREETW